MASQGGASSSTVGLGDLVIFVKDLRAPNSRKRKLTVKSWYSVKDVKDVLAGLLQVSVTSQRLFFRGREMRNARALHDCGVDAPGQTLFFAIHREVAQRPWSLEPYDSLEPPRALARVINQIKRGLELGLAPALSLEGTGGTYFMTDTRKRKLAAFKPQDEEPFAPNNPRGFVGMGHGGSGGALTAPPSALFPAAQLGSLQEFVHHTEVVADISPSKLGARQVHKIAILDIRLLNGDRNDANILVRRSAPAHHNDHHLRDSNGSGSGGRHARGSSAGQAGELELVPIDHGYCLPDMVEIGWCDWCWLDWPQLKKPLDKETLQYVLSLDPQGDAERLGRKLSLRAPCLRNFRVAGTLLKAGVAAGLTLHDVATIVVRHDLDERSELERIMRRARELARAAVDNVALPPAAAAVSAAAGTPAGGGGGGSGHRRAGGRDHPTDHVHRQPGHSGHCHRHHHNGHRHHSRSGEAKGEENRHHRDNGSGRGSGGDGDGGSAYDEDNEDSERAGGGRGRRACSSDGGGDRVGLPIEDDTSPEPPVIVGGGALQRMRSNSELPPRSLNGGGLMNGGGGSGAVAGGSGGSGGSGAVAGGSGGGGRAASSRSASGGHATASSEPGGDDEGTSSPMQPLPRPAPGALPLAGSSGSSSDGGGSGSAGFGPGKTRSGRLLSVPEVDPLPPPALVAARGGNRGASGAAPPPPAVGDGRGCGGAGGAGNAAAAAHALSFGAKIVRSYSYHGLRSEALYDSPDRRRSSRVGGSQLRRVAEDSDEFGEHFFRFVGMLIQSMGATEYEPRVVMQLAERLRRFTADLLYDARDYATHARRAEIDVPDARLAVQERQASLMLSAPQTDRWSIALTPPRCHAAAPGLHAERAADADGREFCACVCGAHVGVSSNVHRRRCQSDAAALATGRADIDVPDASLAVQERQASLMLSAPQTDRCAAVVSARLSRRAARCACAPQEMLELADEMNRRPLPRIPEQWGVRLPAEPFCLTAPPVSLVPGDELLAHGKTGKRGSHQSEGADAGSDQPTKSRRVHKQAEKPLPILLSSTMTADGQG
ncbi:phosphatidylinositol 3 and 4-kinase-domain-containing protein [Tribonema minus]|uniref:Phosphatidylinositol 3 and 4-kinase-domain-containing protein n=1 Tax=Tribonema minus TaxID=303371 RepID=A0A835Z5L8_9STRA|nr:phosphatidylinositol 3 and 4-kinase-domain-containing protein [Tribonema minus]